MASSDNSTAANDDPASDTEEELDLLSRHITGVHTIVIVGMGPKQQTYNLPRTLLMSRSPYFRGCLSGDFAESVIKKVELLDIGSKKCASVDALDVWILADRLLFENLKNLTMNLFQGMCEDERLEIEDVERVY